MSKTVAVLFASLPECLNWVKSGRRDASAACLLHPEKRKFAGEISESALGHEAIFDKGMPERHHAYP